MREIIIKFTDVTRRKIQDVLFSALMEWGLVFDVDVGSGHELIFGLRLTHPCNTFPETDGDYVYELRFLLEPQEYLTDKLGVDMDKITKFAQEIRNHLNTIEGLRKADFNQPPLSIFDKVTD